MRTPPSPRDEPTTLQAAGPGRSRSPVGARLTLILLLAGHACGSPPPAAEQAAAPAAAATTRTERGSESLGEGFVVWESNRSRQWRLWIQRLDGTGLRQLTSEEGGRQHCCPHVSPDGSRIAYLSLDPRQLKYPAGGSVGELRLIAADGSGERTLATRAYTYFEHRGVVWRGADELVFIDGERRTALLDLTDDSSRLLMDSGGEVGWLVNRQLTWAVSGVTTFSPYDAESGRVAERTPLGGCQYYFTDDGRWGFWMGGAGGPVYRMELASGEVGTILKKNDERLLSGPGYIYFPMISRDSRLLAFAASDNAHDHYEADYEVFVAEVDPESLEVIGRPLRVTEHPAVDRYPDVFLQPLPLGRLYGEAPYRVRLEPAGGGSWQWEFGDGTRREGAVGEHTYQEPGRYTVRALQGDAEQTGQVVVGAARPPRAVAADLRRQGAEIVVRFDEPIAADEPRLDLDSGIEVESWSLGEDGRSLRLVPAERIRSADRLRIGGVFDRAERPNRLESAELAIEPPLWPASREDLVFLWQTGDAPNLIWDPELDAERAATLEARGAARLDHDFALQPAGGHFVGQQDLGNRMRWAMQGSNEMTLQVVIEPDGGLGGGSGVIVAMAEGAKNFGLVQRGNRLFLGFRFAARGPQAYAEIELPTLPPGRKSHLALTYTPGRLEVYVDGERRLLDDRLRSGFFHWRSVPLTVGSWWNGAAPWKGRLEGLAIYSRLLSPEEVAEDAARYRSLLEARPRVARFVVEAVRADCARPATLSEISPYREALFVCEYQVERVLEGDLAGGLLRVADWSMLDGQSVDPAPAGQRSRLVLERFEANRQLESVYLADTPGAPQGPLYYRVH